MSTGRGVQYFWRITLKIHIQANSIRRISHLKAHENPIKFSTVKKCKTEMAERIVVNK
jgi:hypothetical protein